jgi:hypothetical protein
MGRQKSRQQQQQQQQQQQEEEDGGGGRTGRGADRGDDHDDLLGEYLSSAVHACLLHLCGGEGGAADSDGEDERRGGPPLLLEPPLPPAWRDVLRSVATSTVSPRAVNRPWSAEIRTAPAYLSRFGPRGGGKSRECGSSSVTLVSALGVRRTVSSSRELGRLLLLELESELQRRQEEEEEKGASSGCSASRPSFLPLWMSHEPSNGMIYATTPSKLREMRSAGLQPCPHCPYWFKGLWWHVQRQHSSTHAQARQEQSRQNNPLAMVVYRQRHQHQGLPSPPDPRPGGDAPSSEPAPTRANLLPLPVESAASIPDLAGGSPDDGEDDDASAAALDPWECAKSGDACGLRRYLSLRPGFDPDRERDGKGALLIHWAAGGGHADVVRLLVREAGCDPAAAQRSRRSFGGRTALHWASRNGHAGVVELLLRECGADPALETQDGTNALGWAAWQGHVPVLRCLHARDPRLARSVNRFGCNAALWAAQGAFEDPPAAEVMEFLESSGCDLHLVNANGHGVLHKAAQRGRRGLAEWFVGRLLARYEPGPSSLGDGGGQDGADGGSSEDEVLERLVGPDAEGCTPSDLAGIEDHEDLARYLAGQEERLAVLRVRRAMARERRRGSSFAAGSLDALLRSRGCPAWLGRAAGAGPACRGDPQWEAGAGVGRMRAAVLAELAGENWDGSGARGALSAAGDPRSAGGRDPTL